MRGARRHGKSALKLLKNRRETRSRYDESCTFHPTDRADALQDFESPSDAPPEYEKNTRDTRSTIKSDEEREALGGMGRVHENYERTDEKHAADTTNHAPSTQPTAQMHRRMANHPATRHHNTRTPRDTGSTIKSDEERGALGGMLRVHENYERTDEKHAADTTNHVPSTQPTAQMHHRMANHPATRHHNTRTPRDTGSTIKSDEERGALGGMGGARDKYENPDETRSRHDRNLPWDT